MAISSEEKCGICRFPCKSDVIKVFCKFYPKDSYLGHEIHFKDPEDKKHETTSRMCVVCKNYFNYRNIHWKKEEEGYYTMCKDCVKTAHFIDNMVLN